MGIDKVGVVRTDISDILNKIREVSNKSHVFNTVSPHESKDFGKVFETAKASLSSVSASMDSSDKLKDAYISGDSTISLSQVVVANEKSKLAFEGLLTVRNKCLEAYKEIMNMPV